MREIDEAAEFMKQAVYKKNGILLIFIFPIVSFIVVSSIVLDFIIGWW